MKILFLWPRKSVKKTVRLESALKSTADYVLLNYWLRHFISLNVRRHYKTIRNMTF